jgi:hypothetical protein
MKRSLILAELGLITLLAAPLGAQTVCQNATLQPGDTFCMAAIKTDSASASCTSQTRIRCTVTDDTNTASFTLIDQAGTGTISGSWNSTSNPELFTGVGGIAGAGEFQVCAHRRSDAATSADVTVCLGS